MGLYPFLFNQYLGSCFPARAASAQWTIALAVIWGATAINLRGPRRVGWASIGAGLFIVAAFLALALASVSHWSHAPWIPFAVPGQQPVRGLAVGLSIALWHY